MLGQQPVVTGRGAGSLGLSRLRDHNGVHSHGSFLRPLQPNDSRRWVHVAEVLYNDARGRRDRSEFDVPAEVHRQAELTEQGRLRHQGLVGGRGIRSVDHIDVVGLVAGHELVTADAVQNGVHDRPLRRGRVESSLGLLGRQLERGATADVDVQRAVQ